MLTRIISLLPPYRAAVAANQALESELSALRESHAELAAEKTRLEDRLEDAMGDRKHLWNALQQSQKAAETAYQAHINVAWQQRGAPPPFPDSPHLEKSAPLPENGTIPRRLRPSEAVARGRLAFVNGLVEGAKAEYEAKTAPYEAKTAPKVT